MKVKAKYGKGKNLPLRVIKGHSLPFSPQCISQARKAVYLLNGPWIPYPASITSKKFTKIHLHGIGVTIKVIFFFFDPFSIGPKNFGLQRGKHMFTPNGKW